MIIPAVIFLEFIEGDSIATSVSRAALPGLIDLSPLHGNRYNLPLGNDEGDEE